MPAIKGKPAPNRKILPEIEIVEKYTSGSSAAELARQYGVSVNPIFRGLLAAGIASRKASPRIGRFSGGSNPAWKGGRRIRPDGYMLDRGVLEHRRVMANALGRELLQTEVVHHIDGNRLNNIVENLEVMTQRQHIKEHRPLRYTPDNVRKYTYDGECLSVNAWAIRLNRPPARLYARIRLLGWPEAITRPIRRYPPGRYKPRNVFAVGSSRDTL